MKPCALGVWILSGSTLCWLLASKPTAAQITPDTTLPINSKVTPQDNIRVIEAGTPRGDNLFHSFREFSLSAEDTAFFNNNLAVKNIITRITGGSGSDIDGTIRANGAANLFFINPNGIIFGQNASLKIGGSFVASTADSLRFADGKEFSATAPQASPLLTVSVPIGLQFGSNPGEIVNRSLVRLQVPGNKTLALVGGNVALEGGSLIVAEGRVELGSVAGTGFVDLTAIEKGYILGYAGVENFQDIQLSQGAIVDASGSSGGAIKLQGRNISLTDDSLVFSETLGAGTGGVLATNATESVNLSGGALLSTGTYSTGSAGTLSIATKELTVEGGAAISAFTAGAGQAGDLRVTASDFVKLVGTGLFPSGIFTQVFATGNGGNLTIDTGQLLIRDGAAVDASTFGAGQAGNVMVTASDSVELVGTGPQFPSGIFAQVAKNAIADAGDAGKLTINTRLLTILDGAQVSVAGRRGGSAGTLIINASDAIQLSGASPRATLIEGRSGIFASAEPGATEKAGNLNVTTEQLTVENGAEISTNNFGPGEGGNATLEVRQLIIQDGGEVRARSFDKGPGGTLTVNAAESVQVIGTGTIGANKVASALSTQAQASGAAGDLKITTGSLNVRDEAEVTVSSTGSGTAGNLEVLASSIRLDKEALLSAETQGGQGNIILDSQDVLLSRGSNITTNATGTATGGNIIINTDVLVALENSDISANAQDAFGGQVRINAQGIFGTEAREQPTLESDITASSDLGPQFSGSVEINTPDVDPSQGLANLPTEPINTEIAQDCQAGGGEETSRFISSGSGGLPTSPYEPLESSDILADVQPPTQWRSNSTGAASASTSPKVAPDRIVEAQGWNTNEKGEVVLVAEVPHDPSSRGCRLR